MMTSRPSRPASRSGLPLNAFNPSASITSGIVARSTSAVMNCWVAGGLAEARAERDDVARHLEHALDTVGIDPGRSDRPAVSSSASVMYSGPIAATTGLAARRRRDRDEPGARPKRADGRQVRGARLAARAGDDEHAAVVALVTVGHARRDELAHAAARQQRDARPLEALDDVRRNADVGDDDVAGARFAGREDQRQLGGAERDGRIRLDRLADRVDAHRRKGRRVCQSTRR